MVKTYQPVRFRDLVAPYNSDYGTLYEANSGFFRTPDMTQAVADAITTAAGGLVGAGAAPCGVKKGFEPRKLQFIRADGSSISVPIANMANIITAGNTIKGAFAGLGIPVRCVKLIGEVWKTNIQEEFLAGSAPNAFVAGVSNKPTTGGIQNTYVGVFRYITDAPFNGEVLTRVKINTPEVDALPATAFGAAISVALSGASPLLIPICSSDNRRTRRFIISRGVLPDALAKDPVTESTQAPVMSGDANDVFNAGLAFAALPELLCLKYEGESNNAFNKLLS